MKSGAKWQKVAQSGGEWRVVAESGGEWQSGGVSGGESGVASCGECWRVAEWQRVAECVGLRVCVSGSVSGG